MAAAVAPEGTRLRWVDGDWLREQGVDGADLPLWSEGGREQAQRAGPRLAARRTGLRARPVAETILDTWRWMSAGGGVPPGEPAGSLPSGRPSCCGAQRIRMSPSWATEATSVPSAEKIRACAKPRPPVAVGETWS